MDTLTCESCNGSGRIYDHEAPVRHCDDCGGLGYYYAKRAEKLRKEPKIKDIQCPVCGIGFILLSGRCDHCDSAPPFRITPECQPVFPCWIFNNVRTTPHWYRAQSSVYFFGYMAQHTPWSPDSPHAPTVTPDNK